MYFCVTVAACMTVEMSNDAFAIIKINVFSLMLKGPGFKSNVKPPSHRGNRYDLSGMSQARNLPSGYAKSLEMRSKSALVVSLLCDCLLTV